MGKTRTGTDGRAWNPEAAPYATSWRDTRWKSGEYELEFRVSSPGYAGHRLVPLRRRRVREVHGPETGRSHPRSRRGHRPAHRRDDPRGASVTAAVRNTSPATMAKPPLRRQEESRA